MLAASTASAYPYSMPSARCDNSPTPPEAITGTGTACEIVRVSSRSNPILVPSRSMLVSKISPAPESHIRHAHSTASSPRGVRPPWVYTSQAVGSASGILRASIATTMHCEPKRPAASEINSGRSTADVLIDILSAPTLRRLRIFSTLRTPPPTVSGMNTCLATASTMCKMVSRPLELAVISRNVNSSAPCWS